MGTVMNMEIGSEFWTVEINVDKSITINDNHKYLLSGRTALDFIIKDIKRNQIFRTVYLPNYCCHSMIQPFLDNEILVEFYDISFKKGVYSYDVNFNCEFDVLLIMDYFGFRNNSTDHIINESANRGKIIIEDATHSFFGKFPYNKKSDYVLSSIRKWTGLESGALAIKRNSDFNYPSSTLTNDNYINLRKTAALLKKNYIEKSIGSKNEFLKLFSIAEKLLEEDYVGYVAPDSNIKKIAHLDIDEIIGKRKQNAKLLVSELKKIKQLETMREISDTDTPLFVPIIIADEKRNQLRKWLIDNNVYCPVHWPISDVHPKKFDDSLYKNSLSLVCDQRYGIQEMQKVIKLIKEFYEVLK